MSPLLALAFVSALGDVPQFRGDPWPAAFVGCFAAQPFAADFLEEVDLRAGDSVVARFGRGPIDGLDESPLLAANDIQLLILRTERDRGYLVIGSLTGQTMTITGPFMVYRIDKDGDGWAVSEGNGGLATYRALRAYVGKLMDRPGEVVTIDPISNPKCQIPSVGGLERQRSRVLMAGGAFGNSLGASASLGLFLTTRIRHHSDDGWLASVRYGQRGAALAVSWASLGAYGNFEHGVTLTRTSSGATDRAPNVTYVGWEFSVAPFGLVRASVGLDVLVSGPEGARRIGWSWSVGSFLPVYRWRTRAAAARGR